MDCSLGYYFIRLLKLIAIPLVFLSLVKGISNLKNIKELSRMGLKTLLIYIITTIFAVSIGLGMVNLIKPGKVFPQEKAIELQSKYGEVIEQRGGAVQQVKESSPLQFMVDMVLENLVQAAGDNTAMLQIILIAIFFGVAMVGVGEKVAAPVMAVVDSVDTIVLKIIDYIMLYAPFGVLALMAELVVDFSGEAGIFAALGVYALTLILALLFLIFIFYPTLLKLFTRISLKRFFKAITPVQLLAFSTSSSAATLPVTLEQCEKELGISNEVASFVLPVGVTINMDGTSCYQAVAAVFIAQVLGLDLTFSQLLTILLVATISSIGTPGIPGGSIVMLMLVLGSVGIPAEGLALILGVDRPLDMLRTVVNVTGDTTVTCIIEEGQLKQSKKSAFNCSRKGIL
ncbi:MAG: dicarboxylate/amino acid:cation symporter [Odoribacter sp.]|nr:dicarboxylate/amino acid:cation symporter [Odoribacter sp.]